MKIRKITSLTALISFILLFITSIVLFIVPQGRIAYWADWRFLSLSKTQWGEIHINLGILFILAISLHIYYNWNPILAYLKTRAKAFKLFTPEFNLSLAITLIVFTGTLFHLPPFSTILDFNTAIKDTAAQKYGEPPFGHAELAPLHMLVKKTGGNPDQALARLREKGIRMESPDQIFLDIAKANTLTPKQLFEHITPQNPRNLTLNAMPESPESGAGNLTLIQLCEKYDLDTHSITKGLAAEGLTITPDKLLKSIATENQLNPFELYAKLRKLAETQKQ